MQLAAQVALQGQAQMMDEKKILEALKAVVNPATSQDVVSDGLISSLVVREGSVGFALEISPEDTEAGEALRRACELAVRDIPGVEKTMVVMTAQKPGEQEVSKIKIPNVKQVIMVASGKGGVGKSTVAYGLARGCAEMGLKTAIVDADIYGPSIPMMLGLEGKPEINQEKKMVPLEAKGLYSMSIGYLVDTDRAAIWRGPMATKALYQLLQGTSWPEIDVMIIDMPPGTGDIQLSLTKQFHIDGVVLVTLPHMLSLIDVKKAYQMFKTLHIPILGVVENMSYFQSKDGIRHDVFGEGGGVAFAKEHGLNLLAQIPLNASIGAGNEVDEVFMGVSKLLWAS